MPRNGLKSTPKALFHRRFQVWRVRFELGTEDVEELSGRLAALARAVASAEAFSFQERLRSELLQRLDTFR